MLLIKAIEGFEKNLKYKQSSNETIKSYMREMKYLNKYMSKQMNGMVYIDTITLKHLETYLEEKINKGLKATSINQVIYILRSFYNFLVKKDYVGKNIAVKLEILKTATKERQYLTEDEFGKLLENINHSIVKVIAITIFNTGLRISEIINLQLEDVVLQGQRVKVNQGKGNKDRTVPMNDTLKKILEEYLENTRPQVASTNFFATKRTGSISRPYINRRLKEAAKDAGIPKTVTAHILRHSFASYLLKKNVNLIEIQKLLGHNSLKTTAVYAHTNMDQLQKAVNVFN